MLKFSRIVGVFAALLGFVCSPAQAVEFEKDHISLICAGQPPVSYVVEMAITTEQRRQGLMYRSELPRGAGMLFDFGQSRDVTMWMRNTYIALDMLFIDEAGAVVHIHRNAAPLDETYISPGVPVRAVLEIQGGAARADQLKEGCVVNHALFHAN